MHGPGAPCSGSACASCDAFRRDWARTDAEGGGRDRQAAKLRFGSLKLLLTSFEGLRVIHINGGNLVITLLAETDANIGVMVEAAPQLVKALRAVNHEVAHARNEES